MGISQFLGALFHHLLQPLRILLHRLLRPLALGDVADKYKELTSPYVNIVCADFNIEYLAVFASMLCFKTSVTLPHYLFYALSGLFRLFQGFDELQKSPPAPALQAGAVTVPLCSDG